MVKMSRTLGWVAPLVLLGGLGCDALDPHLTLAVEPSEKPAATDPPRTLPDGGIMTDSAMTGVCARCGACEERRPIDSALHVAVAPEYTDTPPVGGMHHPCWGDYRVYGDADALPPERWIHNLEHGAIVWLYHCPDGCPAEVEQLSALVATHPRSLLTPYTDMPAGFAAMAWGVRLVTECFDLDALERFYNVHFDQGRESVTSGAPSGC